MKILVLNSGSSSVKYKLIDLSGAVADVMAEAARAGTVCVLGGAAAENAAAERGWTATRLL